MGRGGGFPAIDSGDAARLSERLGTLVRAERHRRQWTQDELADRAGVCRDTVSQIENGHARLRGRTAGKVLRSLEIAEECVDGIDGNLLRGSPYQLGSSWTPTPRWGLSEYVDRLRSLSDEGLLESVVHDPRASHRMAYLDAIECRWHTFEGLATNRLPLQFRDNEAIEEAARSLVGHPEDREAYVVLRRAYAENRWRWLEEHPTRRRQQVVISATGLTDELRGLGNKTRAEQLVVRVREAVVCYPATFTLLVVDVGGVGLPEVEVVSTRSLDLADTNRIVAEGRTTVAVQHLRQGPGDPPRHYDLAVHFDPPFVERFFDTIRGFWMSALGQYRLLDPGTCKNGTGPVVAQMTVARAQDCLRLAYP